MLQKEFVTHVKAKSIQNSPQIKISNRKLNYQVQKRQSADFDKRQFLTSNHRKKSSQSQ